MKRKKRRILKFIFTLIILGIISYLVYINFGGRTIISDSKYDEALLNQLDDDIKAKIESKKYSKVVDRALSSEEFEADNLDLYYEVKNQEDENLIANINMLATIGYNADEISLIYSKLDAPDIPKLKNSTYTKNLKDYLAINYFQPKYLNRYQAYQKKTNYDYEKTITYVNIGLDYNFYDETIIEEIKNPEDPLVLVNKYRKLPKDFSPALVTLSAGYRITTLQVTDPTKNAFEDMCDAAAAKGLVITAVSTYRTYTYQENLYNTRVAERGIADVDKSTARPGFSEHHTGLALDVQDDTVNYTEFGTTEEYQWVKTNAHLYGFIIRYPEGKGTITGYSSEAWHLRYVGIEVATYIHDHDITFDEYWAQFLID